MLKPRRDLNKKYEIYEKYVARAPTIDMSWEATFNNVNMISTWRSGNSNNVNVQINSRHAMLLFRWKYFSRQKIVDIENLPIWLSGRKSKTSNNVSCAIISEDSDTNDSIRLINFESWILLKWRKKAIMLLLLLVIDKNIMHNWILNVSINESEDFEQIKLMKLSRVKISFKSLTYESPKAFH